MLVGHVPPPFAVNLQKYPKAKQLKIDRTYFEAKVGQQVKLKTVPEEGTEQGGVRTFTFPRELKDGFYLNQLFQITDKDEDAKKPVDTWEHIFNVDTKTEGRLQRISQEDAKGNVLHQHYPEEKIHGPTFDPVAGIINKQSDLSDSAWFFLFFIVILVSEQALAVHLSYHLRGAENQLPAQAVTSQLKAA
jgi:hypothetical protein